MLCIRCTFFIITKNRSMIQLFPVNLGVFFKGTKTNIKIGTVSGCNPGAVVNDFGEKKHLGLVPGKGKIIEHGHGIISFPLAHKKHGLFLVMQRQGSGMGLFLYKESDPLFTEARKKLPKMSLAGVG